MIVWYVVPKQEGFASVEKSATTTVSVPVLTMGEWVSGSWVKWVNKSWWVTWVTGQ